MGGNALKEYGADRVDKNTYLRLEKILKNEILAQLKERNLITEYFIPSFLDSKESFGDIDVLISATSDNWEKIRDYVRTMRVFNNTCYAKNNGNVWSFLLDGILQIDFIFTEAKYFEVYKNFIFAGDASMIFGRIARLFDLKYGIYGLEFIVRDEETSHVLNEINISTNPREIMTFLGYNYDIWTKGFNTEDELIQYVFSSKYVTQEFLTAYSENTKHRKRDKNRDQYKRIYEWFLNNKDKFPIDHGLPTDLESRLKWVDDFFKSDISTQYKNYQQQILKNREAREKWSGKNVIDLLSLENHEIGKFMTEYNKHFGTVEQKTDIILSKTIEELQIMTIDIYTKYKNTWNNK